MKRFLKVKDVAEILNIDIRTTYRLLAAGQLPGMKIRGASRVDPDDLADFIVKAKNQFSLDTGYVSEHDSFF